MPSYQPPETGTMVIAALLLEAIVFAGVWILSYAANTHPPWELLPWFGGAALVIIVLGLLLSLLPRGKRG